jgi:hypothetical protein
MSMLPLQKMLSIKYRPCAFGIGRSIGVVLEQGRCFKASTL